MVLTCPDCGAEIGESTTTTTDEYGALAVWVCDNCGPFRNSCPDCGTDMAAVNDMSSEKANWICPECAPDYALATATIPPLADDPLPKRQA